MGDRELTMSFRFSYPDTAGVYNSSNVSDSNPGTNLGRQEVSRCNRPQTEFKSS